MLGQHGGNIHIGFGMSAGKDLHYKSGMVEIREKTIHWSDRETIFVAPPALCRIASAVPSKRPSRDTASQPRPSRKDTKSSRSLPVLGSQIRVLPSLLPEASKRPSGLKATPLTESASPPQSAQFAASSYLP